MRRHIARARTVPALIASALAVAALTLSEWALAQQPSVRPYESEEDLWEALREGEITQDEYDDLIETIRLGLDSAFVPASDLEALPGSDAGYLSSPDSTADIARSENLLTTTLRDMAVRWRTGFDGQLSSPVENDGYTTGRIEGNNWTALFNWRHDGRGARWQRRVIEVRSHGVTLQAGNVEPRWGRGLVVGRRSRLLGSRIANRPDGGFIQPSLSRFNGLWLQSDKNRAVSVQALTSDIRANSLTEQMIGVQVSGYQGIVRVGLSGLTGAIKKREGDAKYTQNVIGGHVQVGENDRAVLAEIAMEHDGTTAKAAEMVWSFERGRFHG
ncbi:MAG: hypothetical protein GF341_07220, partial [candidate division Zixibacteria bacterium]|nr:hypothetical protein [candidate division Zixibacteria bacterium]